MQFTFHDHASGELLTGEPGQVLVNEFGKMTWVWPACDLATRTSNISPDPGLTLFQVDASNEP